MPEDLLHSLPEAQRIAFYGSLFAMAAVDQGVDPEEWALIFEQLDTDKLSLEASARLKSFLLTPPALQDCLLTLADADDFVRFGTLINLFDIAWADDILADSEQDALQQAAALLHIDDFQLQAIEDFIQALRHIRRNGSGDTAATQAVSVATERLYAAGISNDALRFSSTFLYEPSIGLVTGAHSALTRPS